MTELLYSLLAGLALYLVYWLGYRHGRETGWRAAIVEGRRLLAEQQKDPKK